MRLIFAEKQRAEKQRAEKNSLLLVYAGH